VLLGDGQDVTECGETFEKGRDDHFGEGESHFVEIGRLGSPVSKGIGDVAGHN
jgi:hypothetical protein